MHSQVLKFNYRKLNDISVTLWIIPHPKVNFVFIHAAQDVLIYLFGDSAVHLCVEGIGSASVQELGRSVREAVQIPESVHDAFAFWLCSPLLGKMFFVCFHTHFSPLSVLRLLLLWR